MFGKIAVIEFVLMLILGSVAVAYYNNTEKQIAALHEDKAKLEEAVSTQQAAIVAQQNAAKAQAEQMTVLQQSLSAAEENRRAVADKLRQKNIAEMAKSNAINLQIRINTATEKEFADIEQLTSPRDRKTAIVNTLPNKLHKTNDNSNSVSPSSVPSNYQPPPHPPKNYGADK